MALYHLTLSSTGYILAADRHGLLLYERSEVPFLVSRQAQGALTRNDLAIGQGSSNGAFTNVQSNYDWGQGRHYALTGGGGGSANYVAAQQEFGVTGGNNDTLTIELPPFTADVPEVTKRFRAIYVTARNMAAGRTVEIQYRTNTGGSWNSLVTLSDDNATPGAVISTTTGVTGGKLHVQVILTRGGGASPFVRDVAVVYLPRASVQWIQRFTVQVVSPLKLLDGVAETNSVATLVSNLESSRNASGLVTLVDPGGTSRSGMVTSLAFRSVQGPPMAGAYGYWADVEYVEV